MKAEAQARTVALVLLALMLLGRSPTATAAIPGSFAPPVKWHASFGVNQVKLVGYFNNDARADLVSFTCGPTGGVFVALSNGSRFLGPTKWQGSLCLNGWVPAVGDFNGDGLDDISLFTKGASGVVYVALSDGTKFLAPVMWLSGFALNADLPQVGDFN